MNEDLKEQINKALSEDIRLDGRKPMEFREVVVEAGVIETAEGSARVRIGKTDLLCGVKMEIGTPYPDTPDEGTISVNAEFLPISSPDFEAGPPGEEAVELSRVVDRGIRESKAVDFKKLCITPGEKCWIVNIDICTLNADGNLIDTAGLAAITALMNTKLPEFDGQKVDYRKKTEQGLPIVRCPIPVTVVKFGEKFIVDPSLNEEKVLDARLTVAVTEKGTISAMQKGGESPITMDEVDRMLDIAIEKSAEIRKKI
jgi:exosome complex component RRP42